MVVFCNDNNDNNDIFVINLNRVVLVKFLGECLIYAVICLTLIVG